MKTLTIDRETDTATIVLDVYELAILRQAIRRHTALAALELEDLTDQTKREHPADWRHSPDLNNFEEMYDRALALSDGIVITADTVFK